MEVIEELLKSEASVEYVTYMDAHVDGEEPLARRWIHSDLETGVLDCDAEAFNEYAETFGGFQSNLWDGKLFDALLYADFENSRILLREFSRAQFLHSALEEGYDLQHAKLRYNEINRRPVRYDR